MILFTVVTRHFQRPSRGILWSRSLLGRILPRSRSGITIRKLRSGWSNKTYLLPTDKVIEHQILRKTDQFSQLEYQEQFRNQQPDPLLAFHPLSQFFPVALITIEYPEKEEVRKDGGKEGRNAAMCEWAEMFGDKRMRQERKTKQDKYIRDWSN